MDSLTKFLIERMETQIKEAKNRISEEYRKAVEDEATVRKGDV